MNGLTAYNSKGWNTALENQLKDKMLSGRFKDLTKLNEEEMTLVGHSIWVYVEEKYGVDATANLMYLVKINRSLDRGFRYVTEKTLGEFLEEWYYSYLDRFKIERKEFKAINKKDFVPTYPGKLPMAIDQDLTVELRKYSLDQVKNVFMSIEEPEEPIIISRDAKNETKSIAEYWNVKLFSFLSRDSLSPFKTGMLLLLTWILSI